MFSTNIEGLGLFFFITTVFLLVTLVSCELCIFLYREHTGAIRRKEDCLWEGVRDACWELLGTQWRVTTCFLVWSQSADIIVGRTRPSLSTLSCSATSFVSETAGTLEELESEAIHRPLAACLFQWLPLWPRPQLGKKRPFLEAVVEVS